MSHALALVTLECGFDLRIYSGFRSWGLTSAVRMLMVLATLAAARACQLSDSGYRVHSWLGSAIALRV